MSVNDCVCAGAGDAGVLVCAAALLVARRSSTGAAV